MSGHVSTPASYRHIFQIKGRHGLAASFSRPAVVSVSPCNAKVCTTSIVLYQKQRENCIYHQTWSDDRCNSLKVYVMYTMDYLLLKCIYVYIFEHDVEMVTNLHAIQRVITCDLKFLHQYMMLSGIDANIP